MEFDQVIENRKSIRSFKDKKVSFKLILECIDSALKSPFAGNINNIKFVIIENSENIKKLADYSHQSWISHAPVLVVVVSNDTHLENLYGERGRVYSRQQAGGAIQSFLLKAVDLGLSSCWIGAYTDELIKQLLKIPAHIQVEALLPLGYEKPDLKIKQKKQRKKDIETSIFWEEWFSFRRKGLHEDSKDPLALAH